MEFAHDTAALSKKRGLKNVYLGNVLDSKRESTYCPKCGEMLIFREGYDIEIKNLEKGQCTRCKEKIYGEWRQ